jgi:chromosome segregation ATPase
MNTSELHQFQELEAIITKLRTENSQSREKWNQILESCVNAEAEVEHLQDQLETMDMKLADTDEAYRRQVAECFRLSAELNSIKVVNTKEKADLETRITKLVREYETCRSNYEYAMTHSKEQGTLINQTKAVVDNLRSQIAELKAKEVNCEHLAKKVVKLQDELSKLELTYCPYQKESRNGNTSHLPCGTCVKCKLDAAYGIIERTQANVAMVEKERNEAECAHQFTKKILEETSKNLAEANKKVSGLEESVRHSEECLKQQVAINVRMERQFHKSKAALVNISEASFFTNKKELAKTALASL